MKVKDIMLFQELKIEAKLENWASVSSFLRCFLEKIHCNDEFINKFLLPCEEIFVNICRYAYKNNKNCGIIFVNVDLLGKKVKIVFEDDGKQFDPTKFENRNLNSKIERKKIGGLGIFLAKEIMDGFDYIREHNKNILVMVKELEGDDCGNRS